MVDCFSRNDDGVSIEDFITYQNKNKNNRIFVGELGQSVLLEMMLLDGRASFTMTIWTKFPMNNQNKSFLDMRCHTQKKDKGSHKEVMQQDNANITSFSSCGHSILQVHGLLQQEKVIVSIHPSCKQNFMNVDLTQRLKVSIKNMCSTQVDGDHVQVFKEENYYG